MMGRNHLAIALILVCANLWALNSLGYTHFSLLQSAAIIIFVSIGSLLPDVDSVANGHSTSTFNSKSKIPFFGPLRAGISFLTLYLVFKPLQIILSIIGIARPSAKELAGHRGIMHTGLGLLIVIGVWWLILSTVFALLKLPSNYYTFPLASLALGYAIHLIEDSHTRGGIKYMTGLVFPKKFFVNGSLITESTGGATILSGDYLALIYYFFALVPVAALAYFGKIPTIYVIYATGGSLLLALFLFNMKATLE